MKIAFDEHIPPPVQLAVLPLLDGARFKNVTVVAAKKYAEPPATSDVPWMEKFKADGGGAIVSGDNAMRRKPHERQAITDLRMVLIFLPPSWNNAEFAEKSGYIMYWWPVILELIHKSRPGQCWELPKGTKVNIKSVRDVTGAKGSK